MKISVTKSLLLLVLFNTTTATTSQNRRSLRGGEELTLQQRQALSRAVLTAIRSPTGELDPIALEKAVNLGIPRDSIVQAATMAVERSGKNKNKAAEKSIASDPRTVTMKDGAASASTTEQEQQTQGQPSNGSAYSSESSSGSYSNVNTGSSNVNTGSSSQINTGSSSQINTGSSSYGNKNEAEKNVETITSSSTATKSDGTPYVTSDYNNDSYKEGQKETPKVISSAAQIQMAAGMSPQGSGSSTSESYGNTNGGSSSGSYDNVSSSGGSDGSTSSSSGSDGSTNNSGGSYGSTNNSGGSYDSSSNTSGSNGEPMNSSGGSYGSTSSSAYTNAQPQNQVSSASTMGSGNSYSNGDSAPKRRKFVGYQSSEWEMAWLNNIEKWGKQQTICQVLMREHKSYIHDFLEVLCTSRLEPGPYGSWCVIDDGELQLWFNEGNHEALEIYWQRPKVIPFDLPVPPPQAVVPPPGKYDHVLSKMTFMDEQTGEKYEEYIEPLVSHLRFPLSKCMPVDDEQFYFHDTIFKGFIIPPPPVIRGDRAIFYDAGSPDWIKGPRYFLNTWLRHGIKFDDVFSYDERTTPEEYYSTIPLEIQPQIHYKQCTIASDEADNFPDHPFLPSVIIEGTTENDYVMFKLDIDRPGIENGIISAILSDGYPPVIDELFWEHHIAQNYLMFEHWKTTATPDTTFRESYDIFLRLRQKGIRAHAWT
eukprot:CAMPEP_0194194686 /NCGR_PEP_ID=MMETSP0154-20130528/75721_1 /TAXON_ID=1049557 /ORGANISM="Thalassiothrix antarctica, Strain L6-D1" /LENGTH=704 /DNA_ID=CAMNT_0038919137 /DNA_START=62 /DNA_END=2176 /DNA_ORIENTATION=-